MRLHVISFLCGAVACGALLISWEAADPGHAPLARSARAADGVFVDNTSAKPRTADALQRVAVPDTTGFGRPMTAMTLEVPAGWQTSGGVRWDRSVECIGNMAGMAWSATSPDGREAVSLLPKLSWQVQSRGIVEMNPCPAAAMASARDYLHALMQNARPGARVLSYRDRPDLVAERAAALPPPQPGTRAWYEAGEILIAYPLQGVDMRESLVTAVFFSEMQAQGFVSLTAGSENTLALRAPDGALDFALANRIRLSARTDRDWGTALIADGHRVVQAQNIRQQTAIRNWHQARMSEISWNGILERGKIRMDTIQAVGQINSATVANTAVTNAAIHDNTMDSIQEVQPWRDPSTGQQTDLSIHYQHAWQLDDGRQFLTNDPNFDPSRDLGVGGRALEPVE